MECNIEFIMPILFPNLVTVYHSSDATSVSSFDNQDWYLIPNLMNSHFNSVMDSRPIVLRIDNLPPGKNWKQIKYLIGGIIHHSSVLKVKLLPLMTSLVPPFISFQSCIVTLKSSLDEDSLNDLLMELNTYQWDYYNLYAYTLPIPAPPPPPPLSPPLNQIISSDFESSTDNEHSSNESTPNTAKKTFLYPMPPPGALQGGLPNVLPNGIPSGIAAGMPAMSPAPMMNPQQLAANASMPPQPMMNLPTQRRPYYQPAVLTFNQRSSFGPLPNNMRMKNNSLSAYSYYPQNNRAMATGQSESFKSFSKQVNGNLSGASSSRGLKQIFNERSFRKQMTGRGMFQLQIENFPPYLKMETLISLNEQQEVQLREKGPKIIATSQPDLFGRLRWTILKDYIKSRCPKLLNLQEKLKSQSETSQDGVATNNTREFYVGVYEDDEVQVQLNIISQDDTQDKVGKKDTTAVEGPTTDEEKDIQKNIVNAVIYKAIVGFNDKELYDTCFENLRDQEYSLGYKLKVSRLSPFEENKNGGTGNSDNTGN